MPSLLEKNHPAGFPAVRKCMAIFGLSFAAACLAAQTTAPAEPLGVLKKLSLEELMNIEVTSVSKRPEKLSETASAIHVITSEDIRRSGATTVPNLLRGVPGLHVAQQNSNTWAVSARGFSSVNSEKLLILSDTRSIYTPLFSGVLWDVQDYLLADIERIEVIRGPGAALWGSNAVNGVINITTKSAKNTHGLLLEGSAGTEERTSVAARYGAETAGGIHYRVFGQYSERDGTLSPAASQDDWRLGHAGFRADWASSAEDNFTVQGDLYHGRIGQLAPAVTIIGRPGPTGDLDATVSGGNLLGRWQHTFSATSDIQFRAYYDRTHRDDPSFTDDLDTFDFDLQHHFSPAARHEIVWGANYRYTSNRNAGKGIFGARPESSQDQIFSAFVQDQMTWRDKLRVTAGMKAEHNDFSGFELQPSVRAAWDLTERQMVWAAVSRAVRIPTRLERDIFIDVSDPAGNPVVRLLGNKDFAAERLVAYELGYRWRPLEVLRLDVSLFDNHYDELASLEIGMSFVDPADGRTVIPIVNRNLTSGRAQGAETLVTYAPSERWRLVAGHAYFTMKLDPAGQDINRGRFYEGATPRSQLTVSSYLTLPGGFELNAHFRRISAIRELPMISTGEGIPGYSELDVQLSWRVSPQLRLSLVGQNLLHDHHTEFGTPAARGAIERGVYARIIWTR